MKGDSQSQEKPPYSGPAYWAAALFLVFVWGSAFNLIEIAIRHVEVSWLVSFRLIIGTVCLGALALITRRKFPRLNDKRWLWYLGLGLTGMTIPFLLTAEGQKEIDSGVSAILVGVMPLMTIVLAHFAKTEQLTWRKLIGFAIGLVGTFILFMPEDFALKFVSEWRSQARVLGAAFFYAITTVLAKKAPDTDPLVGAVMMTICGATIATFIALFSAPLQLSIPLEGWVSVAALAIGSSGLATAVYLSVINRNGPTELAKINYFPPFVAVLLGVFWLGEPFTWRIGLAFAIIMLGVWFAKSKASPASPSEPQRD